MKKKYSFILASLLLASISTTNLVSARFVIDTDTLISQDVTNNNNEVENKVKVTFKTNDGSINQISYLDGNSQIKLGDAPIHINSEGTSYYQWKTSSNQDISKIDATYDSLKDNNNEVVITGELIPLKAVSSSLLEETYSENLQRGTDIVIAKDASDTSNNVILNNPIYNQDVAATISLINSETSYEEALSFNNGNTITYNQIGMKLTDSTYNATFSGNDSNSKNADYTVGLNNAEANAVSTNYKPTLTPNLNTTANSQNYAVKVFKLENDVVFNGRFDLGGHQAFYGNNYNWAQHDMNGFIVGAYNEIDLNGHDLILPSGSSLYSHGSITDSVGGGRIIVEDGAKLSTPLVLEDTKHETDLPASYYMGLSSFLLYRCPYLNVTTIVKEGGKLLGNLMKDSGGKTAGGFFYQLPLISYDNSELAMFNLTSGDVIRSIYYDENLRYSDVKNKVERSSTITENIQHQRIRYDFNNANIKFNGINAEVKVSFTSATVHSQKMNLPISPYFDLYFHSSNFNLNQQISLMPGAYMNFDYNSQLNLGYDDFVEIAKNESYQGVGGITAYDNIGDFTLTTPLANKTGYDGVNATLIFNNKAFWNYMNQKTAKIDMDGKINFIPNSNNSTQHHPFVLAGNINIKNDEYFTYSYNKALSENLKINLFANTLISGRSYASFLNIFFKTFGSYFTYYATLPLISNDKVIYDPTNNENQLNFNLNGTYDNGLITKDNKSYAFIYDNYTSTIDNPYFCQVNKETDFDSQTDSLAGSYKEVNLNTNYITYNNQNYIYFQGAYLPITFAEGNQSGTVNGNFFVTSLNTGSIRNQKITFSLANEGYWHL